MYNFIRKLLALYYKTFYKVTIVNKEKIENEQNKYSREIQVEVRPLKHYILAEEYHQNYLDKNPNGYCHIDLENAVKIFGKNKDIRQS